MSRKTFVLSRLAADIVCPHLRLCMGTLNDRKTLKHRRGSVMLVSASMCIRHDGMFDVAVSWSEKPPKLRKHRFGSLYFEMYRKADHAKLLRKLCRWDLSKR